MNRIKKFEEVNWLKKMIGLKDTLEPYGLAKSKISKNDNNIDKSDDSQKLKNSEEEQKRKSEEERKKIKEYLEKESERKRLEDENKRIKEYLEKENIRRKKIEEEQKKLELIFKKFDEDIEYVDDCLYEIQDMSTKFYKKKITNGHWVFHFNINNINKISTGFELNETTLNLFRIIKPIISRIKSKIKDVSMSIDFRPNELVIRCFLINVEENNISGNYSSLYYLGGTDDYGEDYEEYDDEY